VAQQFANGAATTLSSPALSTDTVLNVVATTNFPTLGAGDWVYLTLATPTTPETAREIVKVTSWTGTAVTCVRGQDGTTAQAWAAASRAELRSVAQMLRDMTNSFAVALASGAINLGLGTCFSLTVTAATTFSVTNVPATGLLGGFVLDLTNGGAYALTWWGVKWAAGTAPTLTTSGRDVLGFITHDGGVTWSGFVLGKAMA
jgi:hypothetical protein